MRGSLSGTVVNTGKLGKLNHQTTPFLTDQCVVVYHMNARFAPNQICLVRLSEIKCLSLLPTTIKNIHSLI